jgi:sigma-B regulation protein RsbU (phosphoserine phosphatase)
MIVAASLVMPLRPAVRALLDDFCQSYDPCAVRLWAPAPGGWTRLYPEAEAGAAPGAPGPDAIEIGVTGGRPLRLEVEAKPGSMAAGAAHFLAGVLARTLRYETEIDFASRELTDRYEEITLLYTISEILGTVFSLEDAAYEILTEVATVLGVRRATLWVHDAGRDVLDIVAAVGKDAQTGPIRVADPCSITAEVFRSGRSVVLEPGDVYPRPDCPPMPRSREFFLAVPVSYTPPEGAARMIGVINLTGRGQEEPFGAGDLKLISAIASQVGAAVENRRLVAATLRQQWMVREMELAHDLQLKLLPPVEQFAGYAEVAARCVPAESVGGDFYHLFRLSGGRLGVMIGDVSSHGFGAALIMALVMSAVGIHASEGDPPAEVLRRVQHALLDELETTEMYLTLFYGVIDPAAGRIDYANAGHGHAFRITTGGAAERLPATSPPIGITDPAHTAEASAPWQSGEDLLFLFTDGLSDALGDEGETGEARLLDEACRHRALPADALMDHLFALPRRDTEAPPDDRTAILVRI